MTLAIIDDQIDELLRNAEQRLSERSIPASQLSRSPADTGITQTQQIQRGTNSEDLLAVRVAREQVSRVDLKRKTAGPNWFHLPQTELTSEFKRDWQVLRMRGLLDPKHQKKALKYSAPEFSRVGKVVAGPADFYSARLTRKERKNTIFDEVMSSHDGEKLGNKYAGIQRIKTSGKKTFYRNLVSQRRKR
ncbi:hypothetical protein DCS_06511 [Drechmeria coniospora]|uniref:Fcf2 pre-rRNA processing C-terminal domain-containing protein n=1 Tax=Drechmeria coniospora TaxID=98403 RepID=A0A151GBX7_DRECN|nr:hypothetical protein DCS_06511 [Drechmeria coniospora]KYK54551.1 hypothetical protein DCS_06511 [Drechmeria coniospora]